VLGKDT